MKRRRPIAVLIASLFGAAVLVGTGPLQEASAAGPICDKGLCSVKAKKKASGEGSSQGGGRTGGGNNAVSSGGGGKSGPSRLEIARKQERAINRAVAKFESSLKAYTSCVEGGGANWECTAPKGGTSAMGGLSGVEVVLCWDRRRHCYCLPSESANREDFR